MEPSIERLLLSDRELRLGTAADLAARARALLEQQKEIWPLLREGYENLATVQTRTIELESFSVQVQFNPARITSSSASVDEASIRNRPCFLCAENLPREQRAILYGSSFVVLCNPFPIFREHYTICHTSHTPQRIEPSFGAMLDISRAAQSRYLILYNGPRSGASAPDHLHFQAGEKGFLPIEGDLNLQAKGGRVLSEAPELYVQSFDDRLRKYVVLESSERSTVLAAFRRLMSAFASVSSEKDEPMMNLLASFDGNKWRILAFLRARHRPSFYFARGEEKILLSPAAVDCGGVLITPLERDFRRLDADHVRTMFSEVFITSEAFTAVCDRLGRDLSGN